MDFEKLLLPSLTSSSQRTCDNELFAPSCRPLNASPCATLPSSSSRPRASLQPAGRGLRRSRHHASPPGAAPLAASPPPARTSRQPYPRTLPPSCSSSRRLQGAPRSLTNGPQGHSGIIVKVAHEFPKTSPNIHLHFQTIIFANLSGTYLLQLHYRVAVGVEKIMWQDADEVLCRAPM